MIAERVTTRISIEERREDSQRQRRSDEERGVLQRPQDGVAELAGQGIVFRQLLVVLRPRRLVPGRDAAILPLRGIQHAARLSDLRECEDVGDLDEHER